MAVEQMSTLTVGSTTYEIHDKVARNQNEEMVLEVTEVRNKLDEFSEGGTVEVSPEKPENEHVRLWVDSDEYEDSADLPEIKDDLVSEIDTWSSKKIRREIDEVSTIQVSTEEPTEEYAKVWFNPESEESFNAPEIKDNEVSETDTWSSKKIAQDMADVGQQIADASKTFEALHQESQRTSNLYINQYNYASALPDANNAINGLTYFISNEVTSAHTKNLPVYGQFATLTTIHSIASDVHGKYQLYASLGWMYMRTEYGSGTAFTNWSAWQEVTNHQDTLSGRIDAGHFEHTSSGICVDEKNIVVGKIYRVVAWNMKNAMNGDQPLLYIFKKDGTNVAYKNVEKRDGWLVYHDILIDDTMSHLRLYMNKAGSASSCSCDWAVYELGLGPMQEIMDYLVSSVQSLVAKALTYPNTTCKIFRKVVCCGDSYTSGHIAVEGAATTLSEDFAWPKFMSNLTGNQWENCGCSGCNVLTWQTHERGLPKAQALGQTQAYVIGLMINDASSTERAVPLGTVADIGTDAQTYYGGMSAIIRALNAISPQAKIFVNTCPKTGSNYDQYNQAVRNIVAAYATSYPVHCIDLAANSEAYEFSPLVDDYIGGHYTAIGYQQFAEIYSVILSKYINTHVVEFQNVHAIPYSV